MEIAIISGKGGTGKSSISAAFASLAGQVVLADCDVDAANLYLIFDPVHKEEHVYIGGKYAHINYAICTDCGLCQDYCRFEAINKNHGRIVIDEVLCDGCQLCARICPNHAISMAVNDKSRMYAGTFRQGHMVYGILAPGEENSGKLVNLVREKAREYLRLHSYDKIIIDGPPGIGCAVISSIVGADRVAIITEPSMSGMHDMERALEMVRNFNIPVFVIINKYDLNKSLSGAIEWYCHENEIPIAGKIPFDTLVTETMVRRKTVIEWAPDSAISKIIKQTWQAITCDSATLNHHQENQLSSFHL